MEKDKILKASELFHDMGDLYKEMHDLYDCEDTKENQDKMATLTGKLFFKISEMQALDIQ